MQRRRCGSGEKKMVLRSGRFCIDKARCTSCVNPRQSRYQPAGRSELPVWSSPCRSESNAHSAEAIMKIPLLPLHEQVIVITGASSGIGLVTAQHAAQAGARLVV